MSAIQGPGRSQYDPKIFQGVDEKILKQLGVTENSTNGISEQVFKGIGNLNRDELTKEHIVAARTILEGNHSAKAQTLFHKIFGGITGSDARFEMRMKELDRLEIILPFEKMIPDKKSGGNIALLAKQIQTTFESDKTLTEDKKNEIYNEIMTKAIIAGIKQGYGELFREEIRENKVTLGKIKNIRPLSEENINLINVTIDTELKTTLPW